MIVVANRIPVTAGQERTFESHFEHHERFVKNAPGFIRNEVMRPLEGDSYIIKTYWEDLASFKAWTRSESFKRAHASFPPEEVFAGPNVLEIHEVVFSTDRV